MRKHILSLALITFALSSCKTEKTQLEPISYWSDSSGMALFEVKRVSETEFTISSSLGSLKGSVVENSIRGVTDLQDSFSLTVNGTDATYSILGVSLPYHKVPKETYDSLTKSVGN